MTTQPQRIWAITLASIVALVIFAAGPALALAHGDVAAHADEGGVTLVTTLQLAGVVALLGLGYFVISRQARHRGSNRHDTGA